MQTNMSRQLVVLLFFETPIIESLRLLCKSFFKRFQQEIYEAGIIQYTMNVGTQAGVTCKTSLRRTVFQYIKKIGRSAFYHSSSSHVYLVSFIPTFHFLAFLTETDLTRDLLTLHAGSHRQQAKSGQAFNVAFHMIGVSHLKPHHLITSTNTHYNLSLTMGLDDSFRYPITTEFMQVVKSTFCAWKQNNIRLLQFVYIISIKQMNARVTLQNAEIGKITQMPKQDDGYVHLTQFTTHRLDGQ